VVSADGPMEFHVDGEPGVLRGPVEVTVQPAALKVRCAPAGAWGKSVRRFQNRVRGEPGG
jgi:hypothetical protein